jgi:hypothetical protein
MTADVETCGYAGTITPDEFLQYLDEHRACMERVATTRRKKSVSLYTFLLFLASFPDRESQTSEPPKSSRL